MQGEREYFCESLAKKIGTLAWVFEVGDYFDKIRLTKSGEDFLLISFTFCYVAVFWGQVLDEVGHGFDKFRLFMHSLFANINL